MKTIKDLYEYALRVWRYNTPHAALIFITDIDRVGEDMAYLAMEMIIGGEY